jgi:hypothetical protein
MTLEEFKAEILKANPTASFLEGEGVTLCTPTKMFVSGLPNDSERASVVIGHKNAEYCIMGISKNGRGMNAILLKKTRLMTPQECAGKWIVSQGGERYLITAFDGPYVYGHNINTAPEALARRHKIADTPTSEPYSLEVEE